MGTSRAWFELKVFFREREQVVFTFALPILLLILFGTIFTGDVNGVAVSQLYTAGLVAAGVMSASFQNLGIAIAAEREAGGLKRLAGTPMPKHAYFTGKVLSVLVIAAVEAVLLLAAAVLLYGVKLPGEVGPWLTFCWVFALGLTATCLMGVAISGLPRSAKGASAVVTLPFLVLQFISGVYIVPYTQLPGWLIDFASIFPLRWMCQGFRSVFLGDAGAVLEPSGSYDLDRVALVLAAWVVGGLVLCLLTFRWKSRREG